MADDIKDLALQIEKEFRSFSETLVGLVHDLESLEDSHGQLKEDFNKHSESVWARLDKHNEEINALKIKDSGNSSFLKIMYGLFIAGAGAIVTWMVTKLIGGSHD